jgi:hypothetical protein
MVDDVVGAQRLEAFGLRRAGRRGDDLGAEGLRELHGEQRERARAEREHRLAGQQGVASRDRVPGGDAGAGQTGRLLPAEVVGGAYGGVLVEADVLGEHAGEGGAGLVDDGGGDPAVDPVREVGAGDAVADGEPRDLVPHRDHLPGAVAQRNLVRGRGERVLPVQDQQIAPVEGHRAHTDDDVAGAGVGAVGRVAGDDAVDAAGCVQVVGAHAVMLVGRVGGLNSRQGMGPGRV